MPLGPTTVPSCIMGTSAKERIVLHGEYLSVCMAGGVVLHDRRGEDKDNVCVICWYSSVSLKLARDLALTPESICLL